MSFKASRNKATKCGQQQQWRWQSERDGGEARSRKGSQRHSSECGQWPRHIVGQCVGLALYFCFVCCCVCMCVCIISNFPFSTFFSDFLLFSRFRSFFRLAKLSLCALLHADRRLWKRNVMKMATNKIIEIWFSTTTRKRTTTIPTATASASETQMTTTATTEKKRQRRRLWKNWPNENENFEANASRTKADGDKTQRKRRQNEDENLSQVENEKQKKKEKRKTERDSGRKSALRNAQEIRRPRRQCGLILYRFVSWFSWLYPVREGEL